MTLMPIGQFARASRLSVKSLRNYDQSGLLSASFVDPQSSYRYYELSQLPRADAIRSLRIAGMPLTQIAETLDGDDPHRLLMSHLTSLSDQLDDLNRKSRLLQRLITQKEYVMSDTVTTKQIPAQTVAIHRTDTTTEQIFTDIPGGFQRVMATLSEKGVDPAGIPFTILYQAPEADSPGNIGMCVPVRGCAPDGSSVVELPGAVVASLVHRGAYGDMGRSYAVATAWMQDRGHRLVGPTREIYLNSPSEVAEEDLATELLFPIDAEAAEDAS